MEPCVRGRWLGLYGTVESNRETERDGAVVMCQSGRGGNCMGRGGRREGGREGGGERNRDD